MKRVTAFVTLIAFSFALVMPASFGAIKPQTKCPKKGLTTSSAGKKYICSISGTKLFWKLIDETVVSSNNSIIYQEPTVPSSDVELCKLREINSNRERWFNSQLPTGFPRVTHATKMGKVKWALIPIDFQDLTGELNFRARVDEQMSLLSDWFYSVSDGKFKVEWAVQKNWVRLPKPTSDYEIWNSDNLDRVPNGIKLWTDAMRESDKVFDFTGVQNVTFILPSGQNFIWETSQGFPWDSAVQELTTTEGPVSSFSIAGRFMDLPGKQYWSYWAHEFGHAMALPHIGSSRTPNPFLGLDIMGNQDGESRELSGWMRFVAGWLDDSKVFCQTAANLKSVDITLNPLSGDSKGIKMAVIPISSTRAIAVESRRETKFSCTMPSKRNGVLVYLVDTTLSHGENFLKPVTPDGRRNETSLNCQVAPYPNPILYKGEKVIVEGFSINVIDSMNLDKIRISRIN